MKRVSRLVVALGVVGLLAACRTPRQSTASEAAPAASLPSESSRPTHDRTDIRLVAQSGDGSILGVGWQDGTRVFRREGERWRAIESVKRYPDQAVGLAADPSRPGEFLSLWSGEPDDGGNRAYLDLCRHAPGSPAKWIRFRNPTVEDDGRGAKVPLLTVDDAGDVWLSFPAAVLMRVPAGGGEPEVLTIPRERFHAARAGAEVKTIDSLVFVPDGKGAGWLWTAGDGDSRSDAGQLHRPLRIQNGTIGSAPELAGLPDQGRVTLVRKDAAGRNVWAIEGRGLWRVDAEAGVASPIDSPPGADRILDWKEWDDGMAVALVFSRQKRPDQLAGEIWVRRDEVWMNAGWSGDTSARTLRRNEWAIQPRSWLRHADGILGAGFNGGLVSVACTHAGATVKNLDWRDGALVEKARSLFPLSDGRVLAHGTGASVFAPEAWLRRLANEDHRVAGVRVFLESPIRDDEGRVWIPHLRGRGAPAVYHWTGEQWEEWPLPAERTGWSRDALWVDAKGRVAIFSSVLNGPAWERAAGSPDGWKRWKSGAELVEARAAEENPEASLARWEDGFQRTPVLAGGGRALVGENGSLWQLADGKWRRFTSRELGEAAYRYGFDAEGTPWFFTNRRLRRLSPESGWVVVAGGDELRREQERSRGSHAAQWPDWVEARFARAEVSAAHADDAGDWWIVRNGELWRGRAGEFVRVFADDEPSPFRTGTGFWFQEVRSDARGNRLFLRSPHVLLPAGPAPVPVVLRLPVSEPGDVVVRVSASGMAWFEARIDDGAWRRGRGDTLAFRELAPGLHVLEVRGVGRGLDAGPIVRHEIDIVEDSGRRIPRLMERLVKDDYAGRADAVERLALHGAEAGAAVRAALAGETDEARRWWLRAVLQAIEDRGGGTVPVR